MTFGQASGPPASARQVDRLLALLNEAGHVDFRDARGPMGFTQRQANGKFTVDEVEELIERLEAAEDPGPPAAPTPSLSKAELEVRAIDSSRLAAELQRRGWVVMEP